MQTECTPGTDAAPKAPDLEQHRRRRKAGILQALLTGLGGRAIGIIVNLLSVPLTIGYLGSERYGTWVTIGALLMWLQLADLGVGNGLTNAIGTARGSEREEDAKLHVSNTFFFLLITASIAGLLVAIAWHWIDWTQLFGLRTQLAKREIGVAAAIAVAIFLLQLPLLILSRILIAYQEGKLANYWAAASNILSLLSLLAVTHTRGGLPWLVVAISGTALLVNIACAIWLFLYHKPFLAPSIKAISLGKARGLGITGGRFFLIQILSLIVFQTDNVVIAHFRGPAEVTPYSVTYRLFGYTSLIQTLLFSNVWAAYTEAIARKDIDWVQRIFRLNLWSSVAMTTSIVLPLALVARPLIFLWAGKSALPTVHLIGWMAAWSIINAFTSPIACLLAAASHITAQTVYSSLACAANMTLSISLVKECGGTGVIAATVISYAIFVCGPTFIDANRLLLRLKARAGGLNEAKIQEQPASCE